MIDEWEERGWRQGMRRTNLQKIFRVAIMVVRMAP